MYSKGLVHVVHGDVVPQFPQEVLGPRHRPADLGDGGDDDEDGGDDGGGLTDNIITVTWNFANEIA